jgi:hypothetical protein
MGSNPIRCSNQPYRFNLIVAPESFDPGRSFA